MIRVSLAILVFVYLFLFLAAVFTVWLQYEWRRQKREKVALRHRLQCHICGLEFEDRSTDILPRCPRCGSLNERFGIGRV